MHIKGKFTTLALVGALLVSTIARADYRAAQVAFARGDYMQSATAFYQVYTATRDSGERAKSEWGLAESLYRLGLLYSASKYYSTIVRAGPTASNTFFRKAMEALGQIDAAVSLGQAHLSQLFAKSLDPAAVPGPARGLYFYYQGLDAFSTKRYEEATSLFNRVPAGTPYFLQAQFHLGVVANLAGDHGRALATFSQIRSHAGTDPAGRWMAELAALNAARINYETKQYPDSIRGYALIPRNSDNWLEAQFEAAWAYFLMRKHNNSLGNIHTIHSPFFVNRFFPESYILQSINFLRLCRYDQVKVSLQQFRVRYKPVFNDLRSLLNRNDEPKAFFKTVYDFRTGSLESYRNAWQILDALARSDAFKEAGKTIHFADRELARLDKFQGKWSGSGLYDEIADFSRKKKAAAAANAGRRLFEKANEYYEYLKELSNQTQLINAEMLLGKVDSLRAKLNVQTAEKKENFIGGLQALKLGQELEYWPFDGEYWEDELGYYVYNIDSKCRDR